MEVMQVPLNTDVREDSGCAELLLALITQTTRQTDNALSENRTIMRNRLRGDGGNGGRSLVVLLRIG